MSAKPRGKKGNHHGSSVRFDRIALIRKRGSTSQEEYAHQIDIGVATYGKAERGAYVSLPTALKIQKFTGLSFTYYVPPQKEELNNYESEKTNYNYNPKTCLQDKALGQRACPLFPGRLCLIKWHDPGGDGYASGWPYDRPNRVLMIHDLTNGRRLWWEYNLTSIADGEEKWERPSHVWTEASHEFPALGNHRPGVILYRIEMTSAFPLEDRSQVVEFFIPNDVGKRLENGEETTIYWRKTMEKAEFSPETRPLVTSLQPFEDLRFVIVAAAYDI